MELRSLFALALSMTVLCVSATAQDLEPLTYTTIALNEKDQSYFIDHSEPFTPKFFGEMETPLGLSEKQPVESLMFARTPTTFIDSWHPTPHVQYIVILAGEVEIYVELGDPRKFGPGSVIKLEDLRGQGHYAKVLGNVQPLFAMIKLEAQEPSKHHHHHH